MQIFKFVSFMAVLFSQQANLVHSTHLTESGGEEECRTMMPSFPSYNLTEGNDSLVGKVVSPRWNTLGSSEQRVGAIALDELQPNSLSHNLEHLMENLANLDRAKDGRRAVYLPKERSDIVIKNMGRQIDKRIEQNTYASQIIQAKGLGDFLKVPKFYRYKDYLIEERFPVSDQPNNFFRYYKDPQYFDDAAVAFTIFLREVYLKDIIGDRVGDMVRTDNVVPYLEESSSGEPVGRLALVDLDHLWLPEEGFSKLRPEQVQKIALAFFPYHSKVIKEMLGRLYSFYEYPQFRFDLYMKPHLFEAAKSGALQNRHLRHWDFLIKNEKIANLSSFSSVDEYEYSEDRMYRINTEIQKQITLLGGLGSWYYRSVKSNQKELDSCGGLAMLTTVCGDEDYSACCSEKRTSERLLEIAPTEEDLKITKAASDFTSRFNLLFKGEKTLPLIMNKIRAEFINRFEANIKDKLGQLELMSFPDLAALRFVRLRDQNGYKEEIGALLSGDRHLWASELRKIIFMIAMKDLEQEGDVGACKEYPQGEISFCFI